MVGSIDLRGDTTLFIEL